MRRMMVMAAMVWGVPVAADVMDTKTARQQLFAEKGYGIQVSGRLSDQDRQTVIAVIPLIAKQLNQPVRYFASIAYSPDDGLVHEALQGAMNYHTTDAADAAAIAACNKTKSPGTQVCRVAARVVPKRYEPSELTLSVEATIGFNKTFRKTRGAKSFAISEATGAWGMGTTDDAAKGRCGVGDCKIVIRE